MSTEEVNVNMQHCLRAGVSRAIIDIVSIFPVEGFTAIASDMHVRTLLLESSIRTVIVVEKSQI